MEVNLLITALESGDFHTALPLLENMTSDQLSQLTLPDKCTPLHYACRHGRVDVAQQLITHCKYSIESKDGKGRTPLHTAAQYGQVSTLKYLLHNLFMNEESSLSLRLTSNTTLSRSLSSILELKLSDRHRDESGNTPLHTACVHGQLDIVQLLTREIGCDPNNTNNVTTYMHLKSLVQQHNNTAEDVLREIWGMNEKEIDGHGIPPISLAAGGGHLDIIKYLIEEKGVEPHFPISNSKKEELRVSPVLTASCGGHLHVVKYLLEKHGCNISQDDREDILFLTCLVGHMDIVTYLITEADCDPHCTRTDELSCIEAACWGGHLDVVKYLVDTHNCDPVKGYSLCIAAANGRLEIVSYIAKKYNHSILIMKSNNKVALQAAAFCGHLEVTKFFIEDMKCDPNCKGQYKRTPLHHASARGHLDVVKYLVDTYHCDPWFPADDEDKSTPFHLAAANGQLEVVSYFALTHDCNLLIRNGYNDTPLHGASLHGHLEVVRFFIEDMKCDPNCKGQYERTPLHHASAHGHLDVVKYLVDTPNCDPLHPDEDNETPLHLAAANSQLEVVSYFANTQDCTLLIKHKYNNELLNDASSRGHLEVVRFLIEDMKCDPNCKDHDERISLHHASQHGHLNVVKYLVDTHHCDPLCPDRHKNTPLHSAAAKDQLEIIQYFANIPDCNLQVKNAKNKSPLDIASQYYYTQVEIFLLRATTTKPVFESDILISPSLSIFVLGNSRSGKSTLVKALSDEKSLFGRFITVKDVTPLTAGIVPTTINSRVFGSVNIYDFAGHEEYHVSHEILLQQISHPLVLLTVDISLPLQTIEKQLLYWLSMLSNFQTSHVVVIGSHADLVRGSNTINQKIASLVGTESSIRYHGFIQCDCRYSKSSGLNQLRQQLKSILRSIQVSLSHCESNDSNRLCASLMNILKYNIPEKAIISVAEVMKHIKESGYHKQLLDKSLLVQTCKVLSSNGHLLFMCHENNILEKSLLILNKRVILQEIHACIREIKAYLPNEFGIVEKNQLKVILSESLKNVMEPEQAIKYLIFTQFCTEIASDQLISPPDGEKIVTYYFFPNLALALRPGDLLSPGNLKYTHLYTWCLKCSHARQFFTPRYLHTLFIQLIKCEKNVHEQLEYKIWNKGILIVHNNGTRSIIEVTDQTTRVSLAIQCVEGCESYLVKQRSLLISLIKSTAHKICPRVEVKEFFILPQNAFPPENSQQVPIARIAHSVIASLDTVSYNDGDILRHALVRDLLYFDSLLVIKGLVLRTIFTQYQSNNVVPLVTVTRIHSAVETCRELQEWFEDEAGQCRRDMTYSQLYRELIKYSIFTDGNLYVSCWSF